MEFLGSSGYPTIFDPEATITADQQRQHEAAMSLFTANAERVQHFMGRAAVLGCTGRDTVITVINADDRFGSVLAQALMPGHDWQPYRDAGEVPVARGLASKDGVTDFLTASGFNEAAERLTTSDVLQVVVVDSEVALVMEVEF